jgi:hypothetical protein
MDHGLDIIGIGPSDISGDNHAMPVPGERPVVVRNTVIGQRYRSGR